MSKLFLLLLGICTISLSTMAKTWESGKQNIPLVELYSSEGCSSCPPAEKWMASLIDNEEHFKKFTPVNFHVDYWNQLGWVDRFSNSQFTDRQRSYASSWGTGRVYTPAFVVNGIDKGAIGKTEFLFNQSTKPGNLKVEQKSGSTLLVSFDGFAKTSLDIYFAELANGLESQVTKGENSGRTLKHNFVVLSLKKMDFSKEKLEINLSVADKKRPRTDAFAVWVTKKDSLTPLQSLGGEFKW
jgi:hypothetical protein